MHWKMNGEKQEEATFKSMQDGRNEKDRQREVVSVDKGFKDKGGRKVADLFIFQYRKSSDKAYCISSLPASKHPFMKQGVA